MKPPTIVVVAKYPDIFEGFRKGVEDDCSECEKVLVRDGNLIPYPEDWATLTVPNIEFSCPRYGNIGWKYVMDSMDTDILYCGDDVRFIKPDTVKHLQKIAYEYVPNLGMLSPKIIGCAQEIQNHPSEKCVVTRCDSWIAMMCVYIKRSTINKVGYLDERFKFYGYDDIDFCTRIRDANLTIGVTSKVSVRHSDTYGTTFRRTYSEQEIQKQAEENQELFKLKWGYSRK